MPLPAELFCLWAKLGQETWPEKYHPLICHLIDVGQVAQMLWDHVFRSRIKSWIAKQLNLTPEEAGKWFAFWVGAHDIGKACPGFQVRGGDARMAQLQTLLAQPIWEYPLGNTPGHGDMSATILVAELTSGGNSFAPLARPSAIKIAVAVGGHHGLFCPTWNQITLPLGNEPWRKVRHAILEELARQLGLVGLKAPQPKGSNNEQALWMYLAGLTSVADWIGSNQTFFEPYGKPERAANGFSIDDYSRHSKNQAGLALETLGWLGRAEDNTPRTFTDIFPAIKTPRPLQVEIEHIAQAMTEPTLVIVEAPMGEGKTEAAWYVADRWDRLGGQGCYVALPTMATSNQMFERVAQFLQQRAGLSNVQLLHGKAQLNERFEKLRYQARIYDENQENGAVVAEGWFAANKKHGLLAPFGVGTIDQSLMAVLQTKHVFVRLFGLAGKCIILDEVHAYDTYMTTLLERLLQWLSALGCPVVLLSATLPKERRLQLFKAYVGESEDSEMVEPNDVPYPRITMASANQPPKAVAILADPTRSRTVALDWLAEESLACRLQEALKEGGCACLIRNTVGLAQQTYSRLKAAFADEIAGKQMEIYLFHARFPFGQRQKIEEDVLTLFGKGPDGKPENPKRPKKAILVATQVVEQSLDLDFDLMVSDLAPVDLVLQRAGRLWRHQRDWRPAMLQTPPLWLIEPKLDERSIPKFGVSEYVYARYFLLKSYLALHKRPTVALPEELEPLVEKVYGKDEFEVMEDVKNELEEAREKLRQERKRQTANGRSVIIHEPTDDDVFSQQNAELEEDNPEAHPKIQAATRDADLSVQVIIAYGDEDNLYLDSTKLERFSKSAKPTGPQTARLIKNEISVTHKGIVFSLMYGSPPSGWQKNGLLRHHRLIILGEDGSTIVGNYRFQVDDELGLVVEKVASSPITEGDGF
jgi:CRISPR-associated endonuclease/helicase Cas3